MALVSGVGEVVTGGVLQLPRTSTPTCGAIRARCVDVQSGLVDSGQGGGGGGDSKIIGCPVPHAPRVLLFSRDVVLCCVVLSGAVGPGLVNAGRGGGLAWLVYNASSIADT